MKYYKVFFLTTFVFSLCGNSGCSQITDDKVTKTIITYNLPIYSYELDKQINSQDTVTFYLYNGINIIKTGALESSLSFNDNPNKDTIEADLIYENTKYSYLVFDSNKKQGYMYEPNGDYLGKYLVDSILKRRILQIPVNSNYKNEWTPFFIKQDEYMLKEILVSKENNKNSHVKDTMKVNFSNDYNNVPYNVSKELDNTVGMKLFDISLIVSEYIDSKSSIKIPKQEVYIKFLHQETSKKEASIIKRLVEEYRNNR